MEIIIYTFKQSVAKIFDGTTVETMLKDRIQNHLSDIRTFKKYDKPVSIHFNSKDHSIDDFRYAGIEISRKP
jgi:hypothetical protein